MKTVLLFQESDEKRKAIFHHSRDVRITREVRKDHIQWTDIHDQVIVDRQYIVIRFQNTKEVDLSLFKIKGDHYFSTGYLVNELESETEVLLYDRITFTWYADELAQTGLFTFTQRNIPDFKETGELFPFYINPKGFWQVSYDLFFGLLNLPFMFYRERKKKKLEANEV